MLSIAKEKNINFLFEASVGGGIPIIRPLNSSLTADEIEEITGILNGTTNYMLTKMFYEGADYASVLKEAQDNGYAERNPEADVEGYDACRKIAILSSLISGQQVDFEDIYCEGITQITVEDMRYAKAMGTTIKLLASSKTHAGRLGAMVAPCMLYPDHPLYNVNGVFNAIFVHGNVLGDAMFYGSGAGKLPTASAVVSDVVEAAKIDGATDMQINMKIRLPLIRTIIGTCEILAATSMLREFELIYLTTNGGPGDTTLNLPLYLYKTSMTDNNYGYANMMGVILIIAGVIVVSAINRLFKMNEADY